MTFPKSTSNNTWPDAAGKKGRLTLSKNTKKRQINHQQANTFLPLPPPPVVLFRAVLPLVEMGLADNGVSIVKAVGLLCVQLGWRTKKKDF